MKHVLVAIALLSFAVIVPAPAAADHNRFLEAYPATTNYGDAVQLAGRLLEPDADCPALSCPVSGRSVDFYVDGAYAGTDTSDAGGYAYLLFTPGQALHPGPHTIRVQYNRDANPPSAAIATAALTINKENTGVLAHRGYLQAQLLTDDNEPLSGFAVKFHVVRVVADQTVDQELCTAYTDAAGNARCLPLAGAGIAPLNHEATQYRVTFAGTADYVGSSASVNLL